MTISTTTLKNAAFAIECDLWTDPATGANYLVKDGAILRRWEPSVDDGDSFRLAVGLCMVVRHSANRMEAYLMGYPSKKASVMFGFNPCATPIDQKDQLLAAREAILLCAEKIGAALCQ